MTAIQVFLFLMILFSGMESLSAQSCDWTIQGQVKDMDEDTPLAFAYVFVKETNTGGYTDEQGYYYLEGICDGHFHLVISHLGCTTQTHFLHIHGHVRQDFWMDHNHHLLQEVKIPGSAVKSSFGLMKNTLSNEILLENSGKNLGALLTEIPGVSSVQAGPGLAKPVIHGMFGNRVVIMNQGIPLEGQQWGVDHAPEVDPNNSDLISVIKGAATVRYGMQAMGGVVLTDEKMKNNDPHWHGSLKAGFQTNGNQPLVYSCLRKAFGKSNIIFRIGGQGGGDQKTPGYYLTNTGFRQGSAAATYVRWMGEDAYHKVHYSYFANETGVFRGSHIGNLTDLKEALSRSVPFFSGDDFSYSLAAPRQKVGHHLAKYTFSKKVWNDRLLSVTGGWQVNQRREFDVRRGGRSGIPSLDLLLFSQFYDISLTDEKHEFGIQYRQANNTNIPGTGINPLIPDYASYLLAGYYIRHFSILNLPLEWGSRVEMRKYKVRSTLIQDGEASLDFINIASNLGFKGNIAKKAEYYFDLSFTIRPPEVNELFSNGLHQGVSGIEEGSPELLPEKSLKIVHEWAIRPGKKHQINTSLFAAFVKDYIFLSPTDELRLTIRGAFPVFQYRGTDVLLAGCTVRSAWQPVHSLLWSNSLQYTYAGDLKSGSGLVYMPPFQWQSNLTFQASKTRWFHEMKWGGEVRYTARQTQVNPDLDFAPPPGAYWLTNLFLKMKWKQKSQNDIECVIRAENVFNVAYRNYMNRLRYFADEPGRNINITVYTSF
jgi:iron complex outermembrane receptor protein